ncbi:MAG: hypothetical protein IPK16_28290 [Anaerolineales bacterium]|nr:hypothetical protein [Anaerolineales bacterium]
MADALGTLSSSAHAGEVKDFRPQDSGAKRASSRIAPASAVRMALADAGLPEPLPCGRGYSGPAGGWSKRRAWACQLVTGFLPNMPAYYVSLVTGAHGPINTVVAACASGTQAVADGAELIRTGRADMVVAAGVEGVIDIASLGAFSLQVCGRG